MLFNIGKLYKNYKRLKSAYGFLKQGLKAGRWLFAAWKKRSAGKKDQDKSENSDRKQEQDRKSHQGRKGYQNNKRHPFEPQEPKRDAPEEREEYVTREPRGWQEKASDKVKGWAESARKRSGWQEPFRTQSPGYGHGRWQPPKSAAPYLNSIQRAEREQGIPAGVLARLIHQECRFREDIICGQVISSAGAVGIAQIVPRWHPEARPLDPEHSIFYAARYLAQLNRQFNDWPTALAAYNWGPGNVSKARKQYGRDWLSYAPKETRNYVSQIGQDTGLL